MSDDIRWHDLPGHDPRCASQRPETPDWCDCPTLRMIDEYAAAPPVSCELAEARATIARLTIERDTMRALIKEEHGLMISGLVGEITRRKNIEATAAAYVQSCLCNGGTDEPALNASIDYAFAALVSALEERT